VLDDTSKASIDSNSGVITVTDASVVDTLSLYVTCEDVETGFTTISNQIIINVADSAAGSSTLTLSSTDTTVTPQT
jgi:hypothetical protein